MPTELFKWKQKLLSEGGREVLIKSVLQAIPNYTMSILLLPKTFCKSLSSIVASFWWGTKDKKRIHWVDWDSLTSTKIQGGLGFRDFRKMNLAMVASQAWRLLQHPTSLTALVMKSIYHPNSTFWMAKNLKSASWSWKSIVCGRDLIKGDAYWRIGDGMSTSIWTDKWIPDIPYLSQPPNCQYKQVSELIDTATGLWNVEILRNLFPDEIIKRIQLIPLSYTQTMDKLIWPISKNGDYTVKNGYHHISDSLPKRKAAAASSSYHQPKILWKTIWHAKVPTKIRCFMWRACKGALATQNNLYRRKCAQAPICKLCGIEPETVEHLLLLCPWSIKCWELSSLHIQIVPAAISRLEEWLLQCITCGTNQGYSRRYTEALLFFTCWNIWVGRNKFMFEGRSPDPMVSAHLVMNSLGELFKGSDVTKQSPSTSHHLPNDAHLLKQNEVCFTKKWTPPIPGTFKINCDASYDPSNQQSGLGVACRDSRGVIKFGSAKVLKCSSVLHAEAMALTEACILAQRHHLSDFCIESDCLEVVQGFHNLPKSSWTVEPLLKDAHSLLSSSKKWCLFHVSRTANKVADWITRSIRLGVLSLDWVDVPPMELGNLLHGDFVQCGIG